MGDSQDHTKVLETIDSVLRETSEYETRVVDRPSDPSASTILERKVTSDMVAAKYEAYLYYALLAQTNSTHEKSMCDIPTLGTYWRKSSDWLLLTTTTQVDQVRSDTHTKSLRQFI